MSALVIIMSIGNKPHYKREAVRDTAGIGTDRGQGSPSAFGTAPPQELNPALFPTLLNITLSPSIGVCKKILFCSLAVLNPRVGKKRLYARLI